MKRRTPLYESHLEAGAKMVDFAGWEMPLHYGSQLEEHHRVRQAAGMFDVSHMAVVDLSGSGATDYLGMVLANDVGRLEAPGRAIYGCMLNVTGGVIDDLITYSLDGGDYRLVLNAGCREKDLAWLRQQAKGHSVEINERTDLAMVAVQGPEARGAVHKVLDIQGAGALRVGAEQLGRFAAVGGEALFIARTGYTGEDGYEIILPVGRTNDLWRSLSSKGVSPAGLGARDTLRLEAGMNLYGADMDEENGPLVSGLGWTVAWEPEERAFIGRESLALQRREGITKRLVGLLLEGKGVLRNHQRVVQGGRAIGEITSGGFSPTLGRAIALARVETGDLAQVEVDVRGKRLPVKVVKPPFVRNGKSCVEL